MNSLDKKIALGILIVEDDRAIAALLTTQMTHAGHRPMVASSAEAARALLHNAKDANAWPSVILLDWMLPAMSGKDFAYECRTNALTKDIPIILLSARGAEIDKVTALEAGADDYVTKPYSAKELLARIHAVIRRRAPLLDEMSIDYGNLRLSPQTHQVWIVGDESRRPLKSSVPIEPINISPTEFRLLHFFMSHPQRVFTRGELLEQVWNRFSEHEERTVDVNIKRLRECLQEANANCMINTVRGVGYQLQLMPRPKG